MVLVMDSSVDLVFEVEYFVALVVHAGSSQFVFLSNIFFPFIFRISSAF